MKRPVHHVVSRKDHYRLDFAVVVLALLAVLDELLVVVRTVDVKASVILQCRRVGAENVGTDGVVVARTLVVGGSIQLL